MNLELNSLFRQLGIELKDIRLLRHQDQRAKKGRTPYELWRDDPPSFIKYQSLQSFENHSRLMPSSYWASFVGTPAQETLFAGLYHVRHKGKLDTDTPSVIDSSMDTAGSCDAYELALDPRPSNLSGRLVIDWGPGTRTWIQRPDNQNKPIVRLDREFREPAFPGFSCFLEPLSRIEGLPKSWIETLRSSRGVYLLSCPKTKEQYVGSATGDAGFLGRWLDYVRTGHGDNIALKAREPADYQVSILEVAGSSATRDDIVKTEELWKRKLQSREMGLNR
jgi:hypothetical protein